jgi:hypothetical protein
MQNKKISPEMNNIEPNRDPDSGKCFLLAGFFVILSKIQNPSLEQTVS